MSNCTYRKNKRGRWVVCGPAAIVVEGATVTVTLRNGTTKEETIKDVGEPFDRDGVPFCYGYPVYKPRERTAAASAPATADVAALQAQVAALTALVTQLVSPEPIGDAAE